MDIKDINTENPQSFQLETVKAVTVLQEQISNLTALVRDLKNELQQRDQTYVTIVSHARDIQDVYTQIAEARKEAVQKTDAIVLELKERIVLSEKEHSSLRRDSKAKAVLWSTFTALITSVVIFEIMKAIK